MESRDLETRRRAPEPRGLLSGLYTGNGAIDVVGQRRRYYIAFGVLIAICVGSMLLKGFNLGIDFTGGTQIQFPARTAAAPADLRAVEEVYTNVIGTDPVSVQVAGSGDSASIILKSEALTQAQLYPLKQALFDAFQPIGAGGQPDPKVVSDSAVSGSWGGQITRQALIALAVFLVLVSIFLALYFERAMAVAALAALVHDLVVTAGIYSLVGLEVTPSTVVGLLTILGFSLYDTVVVFDKIKENTRGIMGLTRRTYAEAANLAVNQTFIRSINTSLFAVLPVLALLVIGVGMLGVGVLADLSVVYTVGIIAGMLSSIFLATPIVVDQKLRNPKIQHQAMKVAARRKRVAAGGGPADEAEPDLTDDATFEQELRRERAMAAAASAPARHNRAGQRGRAARPAGKAPRPSGKRAR